MTATAICSVSRRSSTAPPLRQPQELARVGGEATQIAPVFIQANAVRECSAGHLSPKAPVDQLARLVDRKRPSGAGRRFHQ